MSEWERSMRLAFHPPNKCTSLYALAQPECPSAVTVGNSAMVTWRIHVIKNIHVIST